MGLGELGRSVVYFKGAREHYKFKGAGGQTYINLGIVSKEQGAEENNLVSSAERTFRFREQ